MAFFSLQGSITLDLVPCNCECREGYDELAITWVYTLPLGPYKMLLPVILHCINDNFSLSLQSAFEPLASLHACTSRLFVISGVTIVFPCVCNHNPR